MAWKYFHRFHRVTNGTLFSSNTMIKTHSTRQVSEITPRGIFKMKSGTFYIKQVLYIL